MAISKINWSQGKSLHILARCMAILLVLFTTPICCVCVLASGWMEPFFYVENPVRSVLLDSGSIGYGVTEGARMVSTILVAGFFMMGFIGAFSSLLWHARAIRDRSSPDNLSHAVLAGNVTMAIVGLYFIAK